MDRKVHRRKNSAPILAKQSLLPGAAPQTALAGSMSLVVTLLLGLSVSVSGADILRPGRAGGSKSSGKGNTPAAGATDASVALQASARAQDSLARTTQAIDSVRALQASARAAAIRKPGGAAGLNLSLPPVRDGLGPGGLQVDPQVKYDPSLWKGALAPSETVQDGRTNVTIKQTQQQAVLNWQSFNIGKSTTLRFDQREGGVPQSKWVAINKVNDPSGVPSQILGSMEAPGHVYVINRNGILFGGSAQVNLHGLVASSLPINDNLLQSGLLENPKQEFLFSALPTDLFKPGISDPLVTVSEAAPSYTIRQVLSPAATPVIRAIPGDGAPKLLTPESDYTTSLGADARTTITFTAAGLAKLAGAKADVTYTPVVVKAGPVVVAAGAQITSPSAPGKSGGRVSLIGPVVRNSGTISTPEGQTILAAGLQVGFTAHPGKDPSLRGLDTYVGAVAVPPPDPPAEGAPVITDSVPTAGIARNTGLIDAPRGNITIAGKQVEQSGVLHSTTSVSLNGRIDLLADYDAVGNTAYDPSSASSGLPFLSRSSGQISIGAGSVTTVVPELESDETVAGTKLALQSQINVRGRTIHLGAQSLVVAPSADISLNAGNWSYLGGAQPQSKFVFTGGQVYVDTGALISAAGVLNVPVALEQNLLSIPLRGPELADSPLQRDSIFRTTTLDVDLRRIGTYNGAAWVGTPLGDLWGYVNLIQRTVGELTTPGGTITINAGGSVVTQRGSTVDVSGGWVDYKSGLVKTSRVLYGGHLFDIADAPPDRVYSSLYDGKFTVAQPKFGLSSTYSHPLSPLAPHWEDGYRQGAAGGSLTITAPSMALDGQLLGQTVRGPRQQSDGPTASSLTIAFQAQRALAQNQFATYSPAPPTVTFAELPLQLAPAPFVLSAAGEPEALPEERRRRVFLSPSLLAENGFGNLTVDNSDGQILIPGNVALSGLVGGSLTLKAANLDLLGSVVIPAGSVKLIATNVSPFVVGALQATPALDPERGRVTLGSHAVIDASGTIVDQRRDLTNFSPRSLAPQGGSIEIRAFSASLASGSKLDVSGGVSLGARGERTYGHAGAITIQAGNDPNVPALTGGSLQLGSNLAGYSGTGGGTLSIQAPRIQIGGRGGAADLLSLTPEFFNQGGFSSFTLNALGAKSPSGSILPALVIADGTTIEPVVQSLLAVTSSDDVSLEKITLPTALRPAVTLAFNARGVRDNLLTQPLVVRGDLLLGPGASIRAGVFGNVTLSGDTVAILGSVDAPAGSISISGALNSLPLFAGSTDALVTVQLGSQAHLSTAGTTVFSADRFGRRTGVVLPGGSISVSGNLLAESGSRLDVSGASDTLQLSPAFAALLTTTAGGAVVSPTSGLTSPLFAASSITRPVASDAGVIGLTGGQELFSNATLIGRAGGPGSLGGSLVIASGRLQEAGTEQTPLDPTLQVTQVAREITRTPSQSAIGQLVLSHNGTPAPQLGHFAVSSFMEGQFDSLTLGGTVSFVGPVDIKARRELNIATSGVLISQGDTYLSAPHVALGQSFQAPLQPQQQISPFTSGGAPYHFDPTFGRGTLTVEAELIDLGNLSLQGIGKTRLIAQGGEIRGNGTFDAAGTITLRAGQIYPTTAGTFTIAATDRNVVVSSSSAGNSTVTLASAALPPGFGIGSALLGSVVQAVDGTTVTLTEGANATVDQQTALVFAPGSGSITIEAGGARALPWSVGGTLNVYASHITQNGTLRAPLGSINLGWDGTGIAPQNPITGAGVVVAKQVTLGSGSELSVSMIDPSTGLGLTLPYGANPLGSSWIDPSGKDISSDGPPAKSVHIAGLKVTQAAGSVIDLRGGGDLYAYRFQSGNGGSSDLLGTANLTWNETDTYSAGSLVTYHGQTFSARRENSGETPSTSTPSWKLIPQSFAIIPTYEAGFAPYASFNRSADPANLAASDPGYIQPGLTVGDRVHLAAGSGFAAGDYTLLPARYALLPGAALLTPRSGTPFGTIALADGSSLVPGYRFHSLASAPATSPLTSQFEITPGALLRDRVAYEDFFANTFLRQSASNSSASSPRLPADAGYLGFSVVNGLRLEGSVQSQPDAQGRGALIDISSVADLTITADGRSHSYSGIVLSSATLSEFGADSLMLGGLRSFGPGGTTIQVNTGHLTVDNAGTPLQAPDVILAAKDSLTLAPSAQIISTGVGGQTGDTLLLGNSAQSGSGDGALIRVTSSPAATISRTGISSSATPLLQLGAGSQLVGAGITLDSTARTLLDPTARLHAAHLALNSGRITMALDDVATLPSDPGLLLSGPVLENLQLSRSLSLLSYSTFDIFGAGSFALSSRSVLAIHAAEIRGLHNEGGQANLSAGKILISNSAGGVPAPDSGEPLAGTLALHAGRITLGAKSTAISSFAEVQFDATREVLLRGTGALSAQGSITFQTPVLTGSASADQTITAGGALTLLAPERATGPITGGLGAQVHLVGASITQNSRIVLPAGNLSLHATTGDITIGGDLDVSGRPVRFFDLIKYVDGGTVSLAADTGDITLGAGSLLNVSAAAGGGNAGQLSIAVPAGAFTVAGTLRGRGSEGGHNAIFTLDTLSLPTVATLGATLTDGYFTQAQDFRARSGDITIDGALRSHSFQFAADQGSITVTGDGVLDASGVTGGDIHLVASESVTLQGGARLTAAADHVDSAGKGGTISLEAGSEVGGVTSATAVLDLQSGSAIDLSVASVNSGSAALGQFSGTLHLRAPQTAAGTDLQLNAIASNILGASSIVVEGFKVFAPAGGTINSAVQAAVRANGETFAGPAGTTTAGYTAMRDRLLVTNPSLGSIISIQPGAELISPTGNLTVAANWDLSTFRFGPDNSPGTLTLRAAGNLIFTHKMSLSDGFGGSSAFGLWDAPMLAAGSRSWSYRLTAGADFTGADFHAVRPLAGLAANSGSLLLGNGSPALPTANANTRSSIIANYYQTIRTGTGSIDISAARDVQILNPLATIYTAGTQAPALDGFDKPILFVGTGTQNPIYPAQYSLGGGNITISAQNDIGHFLVTGSGASARLVADSSREMPTNWLYRRGAIDPATGRFATLSSGEIASTSWWIDYSNFFQGVGTLGGGNIQLTAGRNISNLDAVAPTNARMPSIGNSAASLLELGGGDISVRAGGDIDGGVYYVEHGLGTLRAEGAIHTNATRAAVTRSQLAVQGSNTTTWLPTTLFVGDGSFDVSARGDVLLGSIANPFLLPPGVNNTVAQKTYFSTYSPESSVSVTSLRGDITLRDQALGGVGSLYAWYQNSLFLDSGTGTFSVSQPWLRLAETTPGAFLTAASLMPPTLQASAFSGDINLVGSFTLAPAPRGTLDLAAAGSINGLQVNSADPAAGLRVWASSSLNLSDADPAQLPGVLNPLSYFGLPGNTSAGALLSTFNAHFSETGATQGNSNESKQALHASGPLHAGDSQPIRIYAAVGDISGLTLFSGKSGRVIAAHDLTDIALYLQNTDAGDFSLVSAGHDIIAYAPDSPLRLAAQAPGNLLANFIPEISIPASGSPTAGDIQVSGPGTLEVLAGHNLDLGIGENNANGTQVGISSIGNARNPNLPFEGANVVVGAGVGLAGSLTGPLANADSFLDQYLATPAGRSYLQEIFAAPGHASTGIPDVTSLSPEERARLALDVLYLVLRDAGRNATALGATDPTSYATGFAAIDSLFGQQKSAGDIITRARDIRSKSGGNIDIFAPAGDLTLATTTFGTPLAPPGILTEDGGNISIFTSGNIDLGVSRIFTLRGGNIVIWSSTGDIAAGSSPKTVQTAPPTRVLIDPQSADVETDLAGLATGGGIGVLATVGDVAPGNVDLIAPAGTIDAGDAGIRATGNLNIAAVQVLNADNIQVAGTSAGTPAPAPVAAPSLAGLSTATNAAAAATNAAQDAARQAPQSAAAQDDLPSIIAVEVLGYGDGTETDQSESAAGSL